MVMSSSDFGDASLQTGRNARGQYILGSNGGPGRPRGSRNRLCEKFIGDLQEDWEKHGARVIENVRRNDPSAYLRIVALMVRPVHHVEVEQDPMRDLSDEELVEIVIDGLTAINPELQIVRRPALKDQPKKSQTMLAPPQAGC
jgi:hypothetical protein